MKIKINAKIRKTGRKSTKELRENDQIPAILYGKGLESKPLSVDYKDFRHIYRQTHGQQRFTFIKIENEKDDHRTLIKEMQIDPVSRQVMHLDFQKIFPGQIIEIEIPIKAIGDAPGLKEGGVVETHLRELIVKCLPKHLPESIEVDISELELNESIHIEELLDKYPDIEILHPAEASIISIVPPHVEIEPEEEVEEEVEELEELEEGEEPEKTEETKKTSEDQKETEKKKNNRQFVFRCE